MGGPAPGMRNYPMETLHLFTYVYFRTLFNNSNYTTPNMRIEVDNKL